MNSTAEVLEFTDFKKPSLPSVEQTTSQTNVKLPGIDDVTGRIVDTKALLFQSLLSQLSEIYQYARKSNWDEEGAAPLTDAVFFNMSRLLAILPLDLSLPELLPDNDGYLELEWYNEDNGRNCSLYVTDTNLMLFAAYYDEDERLSGRFNLSSELPSRVIQLIKDVYAIA